MMVARSGERLNQQGGGLDQYFTAIQTLQNKVIAAQREALLKSADRLADVWNALCALAYARVAPLSSVGQRSDGTATACVAEGHAHLKSVRSELTSSAIEAACSVRSDQHSTAQ